MKPIKLQDILKEQMQVDNPQNLEKESVEFARKLIQSGIVTAHHKDLTASDGNSIEYAEELGAVIRNAVIHWTQVEQGRGGR